MRQEKLLGADRNGIPQLITEARVRLVTEQATFRSVATMMRNVCIDMNGYRQMISELQREIFRKISLLNITEINTRGDSLESNRPELTSAGRELRLNAVTNNKLSLNLSAKIRAVALLQFEIHSRIITARNRQSIEKTPYLLFGLGDAFDTHAPAVNPPKKTWGDGLFYGAAEDMGKHWRTYKKISLGDASENEFFTIEPLSLEKPTWLVDTDHDRLRKLRKHTIGFEAYKLWNPETHAHTAMLTNVVLDTLAIDVQNPDRGMESRAVL